MVGIGEVGGTGDAQYFVAGTGADVEAALADIEHDLVTAQPLAQFVDVLLLDEEAVFRKQDGKGIVDEAHHGELMAVQAADIHLTGFARFEVQAGKAFGAVVVADAESHTVDDILEEVASPEHGPFFGEGGQRLEPDGIHRGELVGTAALLHGKDMGLLIEAEADVPAGKAAQKLHKGAAVDACRTFFLHRGRIIAGELDVHVRGHDGEGVPFRLFDSLKPDGAQIGGPGLARDDGSGLLETFDDLLFLHGQIHNVFLVVEGYCCVFVPKLCKMLILNDKLGT